MAKRNPLIGTPCAIEGCGRPVTSKCWCHSHYERERLGRSEVGPILDTPIKRFFAKVTVDPSGCWIWTGATGGAGRYGRTGAAGFGEQAHHFTYRLAYGPVPDGLELDHLCRVTLCVHPLHLEAVTHRENIMRGLGLSAANLRKTHCKRGHAFTVENTRRLANGGRACLRCEVEYHAPRKAARHLAKRAAALKAAA